MKQIEIIGDNYKGSYNWERTTCRGIIVENGKILTSYEVKTDIFVTPGGGVEGLESDHECCIREIQEETGLTVDVISDALVEVCEYYLHKKYTHRYFLCKVVGTSIRHLTEEETRNQMEPRWIDINELLNIFGSFKDIDNEEKRWLYYREYKALSSIDLK